MPKVTLKAAVGYTRMSAATSAAWATSSYVDYNVGASYDFGSGLSLAGSVQGGNKKTLPAVTNPGIDLGFGPFGAQTYSVNKARFIVTLTKTL